MFTRSVCEGTERNHWPWPWSCQPINIHQFKANRQNRQHHPPKFDFCHHISWVLARQHHQAGIPKVTLRGEHLYRGPLGRKDGKLALAIREIEEFSKGNENFLSS